LLPANMPALATVLQTNRQLKELDLTSNAFGADGAKILFDDLLGGEAGGELHTLLLGQTNLRGKGAVSLAAALPGTSIRVLNLSENAINAEGGKALAAALSGLEHLNLSWNVIGPAAGEALGMSLVSNGSLRSLSVIAGGLRVPGALALSKALESSGCALESLDMRENFIGVTGGTAIAHAITQNSRLQYLDLRDNELDEACYALMRSAKETSDGQRESPLQLLL